METSCLPSMMIRFGLMFGISLQSQTFLLYNGCEVPDLEYPIDPNREETMIRSTLFRVVILVLAINMVWISACTEDDATSDDDDDTADGDSEFSPDDDDDAVSACNYVGEKRCSPANLARVEQCVDTGSGLLDWDLYMNCGPNQVCSGTVCVDNVTDDDDDGDVTDDDDDDASCSPNLAKRCNAENDVEQCQAVEGAGLVWTLYMDCPIGDVCRNNECLSPLGDACTLAEGCTDTEQYCLPSEPNGTEGHCATFCNREGIHCPRGWQCLRGNCEPIDGYCRSDSECSLDEFCNMAVNQEDGTCIRYCSLPGESCPELYRCQADETQPNYGKCMPVNADCDPCANNVDCGTDGYCEKITGQVQGCCHDKCRSDADCINGLNCSTDGRCVVGTGNGDCGGSCPVGHICDPTFNVCILNCPVCGVNECCDAASAPQCYTCQCQNPIACGFLMPPCCAGFNCNVSEVVYGLAGICM